MMRHPSTNAAALVLCNGEPPPRRIARQIARSCGLIVAADGGANYAPALGRAPDLIIGDLDSVKPSTLRRFRKAEVLRVQRQDNTDLEKALDYLRDCRAPRVFLLGATGRRMDMTLANLSVLWRYVPHMEIVVIGTGWWAVPVRRECRMRAPRGTLVSLIPYGVCTGVTLRGLRYPLTGATLAADRTAVSNVVERGGFSVRIDRGKALVVILSGDASFDNRNGPMTSRRGPRGRRTSRQSQHAR